MNSEFPGIGFNDRHRTQVHELAVGQPSIYNAVIKRIQIPDFYKRIAPPRHALVLNKRR